MPACDRVRADRGFWWKPCASPPGKGKKRKGEAISGKADPRLREFVNRHKTGYAGTANAENGVQSMARISDLEKMSHADLAAMETRVGRLIVAKRESERAALREKVTELARAHGFDIRELIGRGKGRNGPVAPKYRDPQNPENTWTGRGRMPRWMAAAMRGGKMKKEDFLIG